MCDTCLHVPSLRGPTQLVLDRRPYDVPEMVDAIVGIALSKSVVDSPAPLGHQRGG